MYPITVVSFFAIRLIPYQENKFLWSLVTYKFNYAHISKLYRLDCVTNRILFETMWAGKPEKVFPLLELPIIETWSDFVDVIHYSMPVQLAKKLSLFQWLIIKGKNKSHWQFEWHPGQLLVLLCSMNVKVFLHNWVVLGFAKRLITDKPAVIWLSCISLICQ